MTPGMRSLLVALALVLAAVTAGRAADGKPHRVAIQVNQDDPAVMNLALNNAENIIEYYKGKGEDVDVEIVTYGPGLHMLRADTSPVKDRVKQIGQDKASFPARIVFSACDNTRRKMEKREGHPIPIVAQATIRAVRGGAAHGASGTGVELRPALMGPGRCACSPAKDRPI